MSSPPRMSPLLFTPPEPFSFVSLEFEEWMTRFDRFREISGLEKQPDDLKISTLIYTMGSQAEQIFKSFHLSDADAKSYSKVKEAYQGFFVPRINVIYERARFNQRVQAEGEAMDTFIADLHTLAGKCKYGNLEEQLIRDRLVVGIRDAKLSEKLQLDENLTLTKAIAMAKQAELVHGQQETVRQASGTNGSHSDRVAAVNVSTKKQLKKAPQGQNIVKTPFATKKPQTTGQNQPHSDSPCSKCGFTQHTSNKCPATNAQCNYCRKRGHYSQCCFKLLKKKTAVNVVQSFSGVDESLFLGHMTTR